MSPNDPNHIPFQGRTIRIQTLKAHRQLCDSAIFPVPMAPPQGNTKVSDMNNLTGKEFSGTPKSQPVALFAWNHAPHFAPALDQPEG